MFNFIKKHLHKIYNSLTNKFAVLFGRNTVDQETLKELELILLQADTGALTTKKIMQEIGAKLQASTEHKGTDLQQALAHSLIEILNIPQHINDPNVIMLVGINGSGKTTCAAKIAHAAYKEGKRVLLVAADTFRAAATEQLEQWAQKIDVPCISGKKGQDPAAVIFTACTQFKQGEHDLLIIDTAGRLQAKSHLMQELAKIKRVINKQLPNAQIATYATIDAMLGQNSFEQAKLFHESTDLSAIILTKMDGTGKGGIIFSIADQLHIPTAYISYGESVDAYKPFDAHAYISDLLAIR